jgi:two-component system, chemotaxis family, chemotaxis protein CheY
MKRVIYIVSRERPSQYAEFRREFAGKENIEVVLDRRRRHRRHQHDPPLQERRRYTRRWRDLNHVLRRIGWAVVYQPLLTPVGSTPILAPIVEGPDAVTPWLNGARPPRRRRVLVLDDDPSVRSFLQEGLELEGYEVEVAEDGCTGERLYHERPADVVILDIFLPKQNGLTTLLHLRADFPDAAIIVISGGGGYDRRLDYLDEARALGATRTIRKPFGLSDILTAVNEVLTAEEARREQAQPF